MNLDTICSDIQDTVQAAMAGTTQPAVDEVFTIFISKLELLEDKSMRKMCVTDIASKHAAKYRTLTDVTVNPSVDGAGYDVKFHLAADPS